MAEQQIEIRYVKSPLWRVVPATGAAISGIGTSAGGMEIMIRFTMEWVDIEKETFRANVDPTSGTMMVSAPTQFQMGALSKIEEIAIKMSAEGTSSLVVALLSQAEHFSESARQKVRDAFLKFPKS